MDLNLNGRLALVTGSTRGLGKTIAMALAQNGIEVVINGRYEESVLKTMKEISNKYQVQTWACPIDVTDRESIKTFFQSGPIAAKGKLDILVNNVGNIEKFGGFDDFSDEDWLRCYDLTCMSAVRFTREAIPYLSRHGKIINISSLISYQPGKLFHPYVAAKAALNAFTKQMAAELASKDILVNAICFPTLDGENWEKSVKNKAQKNNLTVEEMGKIMRKEENKKNPLGRMCTPEDVVNLILYLVSDQANFLTGHIYNVSDEIARGIMKRVESVK